MRTPSSRHVAPPELIAAWLRDDPGAPDVALAERLMALEPLLAPDEAHGRIAAARRRVGGWGPIESLLADDAVTDIMVNGPGPVWADRGRGCVPTDIEVTTDELAVLVDRLLDPVGRRVDRASPLVDARLPDGSRVNVAVAPVAVGGTTLTIRRFPRRSVPLVAFGPRPATELLESLITERANLVVSGGTGAGKTTLLNALGGRIRPGERIVVIEDTAELRLEGDHVVRLEARPANAEGIGAVGLDALLINALRMRPDRLVIGEVRGPEALQLLLALNTGHDGCLATCHANDAAGALRRIETLALGADLGLPVEALRRHLVEALDVVVHLAKGPDGERRIEEIARIERRIGPDGATVLHPLYSRDTAAS